MDKEEKRFAYEASLEAVSKQIRRKKMSAIEHIFYGEYGSAIKECTDLKELDDAIEILAELKSEVAETPSEMMRREEKENKFAKAFMDLLEEFEGDGDDKNAA